MFCNLLFVRLTVYHRHLSKSLHTVLPHSLEWLPCGPDVHITISFSFLKDFIYLFFRVRKEEREGNINVWLPLMHPQLWTWPATQACALTGNRTSNPLVCRPALNSLSHTSQVHNHFFNVLLLMDM